MRNIVQEQGSQRFIEGPAQSSVVSNSFREGGYEKAAYHADLAQGYETDDDVNASIYDADAPYYEANERYG